jgi:hypothetical protein
LGLDPNELQAVQLEQIHLLPTPPQRQAPPF